MNIENKLNTIRKNHGPWTAHNLELKPGIFTIKPDIPDRAQRRAQLYAGLTRTLLKLPNLYGLRVLDLGCLEGGISIFLAQSGADCTGIDVRPQHIIKASFSAEVMGLKHKCKWIQGDVTDQNLWKRLNKFDLVICSGLLYHLDEQNIISLLKNLHKYSTSNGLTIIDTNIAASAQECFESDKGKSFWGCRFQEHPPERSEKDRLATDWSSFANNEAFWLTERSLTNCLITSGFGTVLKPLYPYHEWGHQTRDVWVAFPGPSDPNGLPLRIDPDQRPIDHPALNKKC